MLEYSICSPRKHPKQITYQPFAFKNDIHKNHAKFSLDILDEEVVAKHCFYNKPYNTNQLLLNLKSDCYQSHSTENCKELADFVIVEQIGI